MDMFTNVREMKEGVEQGEEGDLIMTNITCDMKNYARGCSFEERPWPCM